MSRPVAKTFFLPQSGKPPAIKRIGGPPNPAFDYSGTRIGRFSSRGTPLFEPGDWVMWAVRWPEDLWFSVGRTVSRLARVSKVTQDGPWQPYVYHLRLRVPVELPNGRRWAYHADGHGLRPADVVDLLAQLTV